ncbi:hypothetical protein SAMN05444745_13611 [Arthrobacter sp. OV608]|nr:hypothetical protein SAMN05444745_13611 [Arthrobacter sp. OV608]
MHGTCASTAPGLPKPGLWLQYDYGDGLVVDGLFMDEVNSRVNRATLEIPKDTCSAALQNPGF